MADIEQALRYIADSVRLQTHMLKHTGTDLVLQSAKQLHGTFNMILDMPPDLVVSHCLSGRSLQITQDLLLTVLQHMS